MNGEWNVEEQRDKCKQHREEHMRLNMIGSKRYTDTNENTKQRDDGIDEMSNEQ